MALTDAKVVDLAVALIDAPPEHVRSVLVGMEPAEVEFLSVALTDPDLRKYVENRRWVSDPVGWSRLIIKAEVTSVQHQIMESVRDNRYTAVPACFGAGKSKVAGGMIVPWWVSVHPPGRTLALTTAPTQDQVRGILWREINMAHEAGSLIGRVNVAQWYVDKLQVALGRKPSNTNTQALQGYHAKFLLIIIDEADAVAPGLWEAVDHLAVNPDSRVLAIGNPLSSSGPFYRACQAGSRWNVIRIPATLTPEWTGEPIPDGWAGISKAWVKERQDEYGPNYLNDPRYQSKVLAIAPENKPQGVIRLSAMRAAALPFESPEDQVAWWRAAMRKTPVVVGLDVGASEGGDQTVGRERRGDTVGRVKRWRVRDQMNLAQEVIPFLNEVGAQRVVVDYGGIGHGLHDILAAARREGRHSAEVVAFDAGKAGRKKTAAHPGFPKARDQLWWEVGRNLIDAGLIDLRHLSLEGPGGLEGEAVMVELAETEQGEDTASRIKVESKADVSARLGHSPDDADAMLMAFFEPPTAVIQPPEKGWGTTQANPWDGARAG